MPGAAPSRPYLWRSAGAGARPEAHTVGRGAGGRGGRDPAVVMFSHPATDCTAPSRRSGTVPHGPCATAQCRGRRSPLYSQPRRWTRWTPPLSVFLPSAFDGHRWPLLIVTESRRHGVLPAITLVATCYRATDGCKITVWAECRSQWHSLVASRATASHARQPAAGLDVTTRLPKE